MSYDVAAPLVHPLKRTLLHFYHRQWWCYRHQLQYYKWWNACLNGLALLLVSTGMIVGPILKNSILVAILAAVGTFMKGWNDFKHYRFKVVLCHFAFTTYAKASMELRALTNVMEFQKKMRVIDDIIIDLTPPIPASCLRVYQRYHDGVDGSYKTPEDQEVSIKPCPTVEGENVKQDVDGGPSLNAIPDKAIKTAAS